MTNRPVAKGSAQRTKELECMTNGPQATADEPCAALRATHALANNCTRRVAGQ